MGRSQEKKKSSPQGKDKRVGETSQLATGMPALDSVTETADFVSPQGAKYTILKTTETDAYDPPLSTSKKLRRKRR